MRACNSNSRRGMVVGIVKNVLCGLIRGVGCGGGKWFEKDPDLHVYLHIGLVQKHNGVDKNGLLCVWNELFLRCSRGSDGKAGEGEQRSRRRICSRCFS